MYRLYFTLFLLTLCSAFKSDRKLLPDFFDKPFIGSNNSDCSKHSQFFLENLNHSTLWAKEIWDATAKDATGILRGNEYQLGNFDECLTTSAPFSTQYCLVGIKINYLSDYYGKENRTLQNDTKSFYEVKINLGVCVPETCSSNTVENHFNSNLVNFSSTFWKSYSNVTYNASVDSNACQNNRKYEEFSFSDISFCLFASTIVAIVIFCTYFDKDSGMYSPRSEDSMEIGWIDDLIHCFSARRLWKELNSRNEESDMSGLNVLYGLRTICIMIIIIDHRIANFVLGPLTNRHQIEEMSKSVFTQLFLYNGDLFVDSFFVLSGLLVTYTLLVMFEKHGKIPPHIIIIARYIRLTPVYAVVIWFVATLYYKIGSGPLWRTAIEPEVLDCQNNWWISLLYLGNYLNVEHMCIIYSWYLPCDFHYLILAVPIVMLLKKNRLMGIAVMTLAFSAALLIPAVVTFYQKLPALTYFQTSTPKLPILKTDPHFNTVYITSHCRYGAYLIGMFTGLLYYTLSRANDSPFLPFKLSHWKSHVLTILGFAFLAASASCGLPFYDQSKTYNVTYAALYAAFHHPSWALGTAILLITATHGHFHLMKIFLSFQIWVPFSKLVYGAYLTHLLIQLRWTATIRNPQYLDPFNLAHLAIMDLVLSFSAALLLHITIETPCRKILAVILDRQKRRKQN